MCHQVEGYWKVQLVCILIMLVFIIFVIFSPSSGEYCDIMNEAVCDISGMNSGCVSL